MARVSLYDRYAAPEPSCTDAEWDTARERLIRDWQSRGWSRSDAEAHIDDLMVWDQIDADRAAAEAAWADQEIKRRKEES